MEVSFQGDVVERWSAIRSGGLPVGAQTGRTGMSITFSPPTVVSSLGGELQIHLSVERVQGTRHQGRSHPALNTWSGRSVAPSLTRHSAAFSGRSQASYSRTIRSPASCTRGLAALGSSTHTASSPRSRR